ncbi:unnamed protein product [Mytilus coruscus]|uniref:TIR domain-containing protein n=1 Tax=Mytilus coruscus TaxID=42192 RepID=A0A6J8BBX7_MYTCO|nr:unnamed protein product [Mytilus coruscus]
MTVLKEPIVHIVIPFDGRGNKYETYMENLQRLIHKGWKIQTIVVQHNGNNSPFSRAFLFNIGNLKILKRIQVKCIATLNLRVSVPSNVDLSMCDKPMEVCGNLTCFNHVNGFYVSSANIVLASAEHWKVVNRYTNIAPTKKDKRANLYHRFKSSGLIGSNEKLTGLANKSSCKCIDQNADEMRKKPKQMMYHSDDINEWKTDGLTNTKYCIEKSYTDKFGSTRLKIKNTLNLSDSEMAVIKRPLYTSAIVLPKYKLIFFWSEKSGCKYWKRIFQYIQGIKMIMTEENAHHAFKNGLFTLTHFKDSEVLSMMNNDSWTKVAFVREPRERILSSFLEKGLDDHFMEYFCKKKVKSLSEFIKLIKTCKDQHWESQLKVTSSDVEYDIKSVANPDGEEGYGNGKRFIGKSCKVLYDISPTSIICDVTSRDQWSLDSFCELMNGTKNSYLGEGQFTLEIECHDGGNISIRQPIKLQGMTSLTVRNCYITNYYDYDFSQEVLSIESVLQNLKFTNCKIEYRNSVYVKHIQKNSKKLLAFEKCQISNTLRTFIFQNSSFDYHPERRLTSKELELEKDHGKELRLLRKCAHNNLTYVEMSSLDRISAEVRINDLLQNGIFNSLNVINLTNNGLERVPSSLFTDSMYQTIDSLSKIDLSRNKIEDISFLYKYYDFDGNLNVDLTRNKITALSNLDTNKLKSFSRLGNEVNIRENPLICTCYQKLFYEFIAEINDKNWEQYTYLKSMKCLDQESERNLKNISEFSYEGMCKKTDSAVGAREGFFERYKYSFLGFLLVFLSIVFTCLLFKYRYRIKQLYRVKTTVQCHCPDIPKCYDAFISYSSSDERWVYDVLCTRLKSLLPDVNLCLHHKDFIPGACIAENIINSVENSRYTLLILSLNFIESEWCQMEFQKAFHQTLKHRRHLLVLLIEDIDFSLLDYELRFFLQTYTYLKYSDKLFWQKLAGTLQMSRDEAGTNHTNNQIFNQLLPPDYDSCV